MALLCPCLETLFKSKEIHDGMQHACDGSGWPLHNMGVTNSVTPELLIWTIDGALSHQLRRMPMATHIVSAYRC
jgi:hypothetical protein